MVLSAAAVSVNVSTILSRSVFLLLGVHRQRLVLTVSYLDADAVLNGGMHAVGEGVVFSLV